MSKKFKIEYNFINIEAEEADNRIFEALNILISPKDIENSKKKK